MRFLSVLCLVPTLLFGAFFQKGTDYIEGVSTTSNTALKSIFVLVIVKPDSVEVELGTAAYTDALQAQVDSSELATFKISDQSKSITRAQIKSGNAFSMPFTFTAIPNPAVANGYQVQFDMLAQRMNTDIASSEFYNFQAIPITTAPSTLLYTDIYISSNKAKRWIAEGAGVAITQDWNNTEIIVVDKSYGSRKGSSATLTFAIDNEMLKDLMTQADNLALSMGLTEVRYFTSFMLNMTPYDKSQIQTNITTKANDLVTQVRSLQNQILFADTFIKGQSAPNVPSAIQIANAKKNRLLLIATLTELLADTINHWAVLAKNNATASNTIISLIETTSVFLASENATIPQ